MNELFDLERVRTDVLEVAYRVAGDPQGWPCILNHGFPYDVECYSASIKPLTEAGARVYVPYLRGYGPTRFLSSTIVRSGEQAALAADLLQFMDALSIDRAVLGGFDWGGRAACIVAALWPQRVAALVSGNSYNIQNIPESTTPEAPEREAAYWYQYYFHCERGRRALLENRQGIARFLWRQWSPTWSFSDDTFKQTAHSFDNPDFVDVVVHSYRHRYGLVAGDPRVAHIETQLVTQPDITVPTIAIDGNVNGVMDATASHANQFVGMYEYRVFDNTGHNLPQEQPALWSQAICDAYAMSGNRGSTAT